MKAPAAARTIWLRNVSHGANDIYWFVLPPAMPLILREFGLGYAAAGGMIAAYLSVIALSTMLMGRLSDRLPRERLVGFGFLLASASLSLGALSPALALVTLFLVIAGIGVSTYHPAAYAAIHDAGGGRGKSYGMFESSGALALAIMLALHGLLVASIGWRGVLAAAAVPGMLVGLYLLLAPGASLGASARAGAAPPPEARASVSKVGLVPVLFVVAIMLRVLGVTAVQSFVPTFLVRVAGMGESLATYGMGFWFVGALVGSLITGALADRRGPVGIFLAVSALLAPMLLLLSLPLPAWAYPPLLALFGFVNSSCFPPQNMLLSDLTGSREKGQVFGALMGFTTLMSSLSPILFGLLADGAGLVAAVRYAAIPMVVGWAVALYVASRARVRRHTMEEPAASQRATR